MWVHASAVIIPLRGSEGFLKPVMPQIIDVEI
jgi:hypothetical protein